MEKKRVTPEELDRAFANMSKPSQPNGSDRGASLSKVGTLDLQQYGMTDADLEALKPRILQNKGSIICLNLFFNDLTSLPEWFSQLSNLEELHMGANLLTIISDQALESLAKLQFLDIGYGESLKVLPTSIGKLLSLRVLIVGNSRLEALPASIGQLHKLEELHAYGNSLKSIPEELSQCRSLRVLNVGRNQIERIPESLGALPELQALHVYENNLSGLPKSLCNCSKLSVVNVNHNPKLKPLPRDVHRAGIRAQIDYYAMA